MSFYERLFINVAITAGLALIGGGIGSEFGWGWCCIVVGAIIVVGATYLVRPAK